MLSKMRYILGHRYGPRLDPESNQNVDAYVSKHEDVQLLRRTSVGRCVLEMTDQQTRELIEKNPQLVIERDERLQLSAMPGIPRPIHVEGSFSISLVVNDAGSGKPVPNVTVYAVSSGIAYKSMSDKNGQATLQTYSKSIDKIIALPTDTYWSRVFHDIDATTDSALQFNLKPLVTNGAYDWGHRLAGFRQIDKAWKGNGIKVAIIDSGISGQQHNIEPSGGYDALANQDPDGWNEDPVGHGTHVAGVVGACANSIGVLGGAPKASVYSVKVMPGGHLSDLVEAIEWCIRNQIDVISMPLGVENPSQVLAGVLRDAYDRGITCVAAAGNEKTHVLYPAAFSSVIGVGAIGRFGTFPEDSAHNLQVGSFRDWKGGLFGARFTNFGPGIDCCAPGVAILSTVPTGYAAWDGTSMACGLISALVALVLEAYPSVRTGNAQQPEEVRSILYRASANLGMPQVIQGWGMPLANRALSGAHTYGPRTYWHMPRAGVAG